MTKALTVLADCVDQRSGKRYSRGDTFDPAPNHEQARRLVAAGCLPESALKAAAGPKDDVEAALEERARREADADRSARRAQAEAAAKRAAKSGVDPADLARQQINADGLFDKTVAELTDLANAENVDLAGVSKKDDIIALIRGARARA